jgi:hypothetical protein
MIIQKPEIVCQKTAITEQNLMLKSNNDHYQRQQHNLGNDQPHFYQVATG